MFFEKQTHRRRHMVEVPVSYATTERLFETEEIGFIYRVVWDKKQEWKR